MEANNDTFQKVDSPQDAGMDAGGQVLPSEKKPRKARETKASKKTTPAADSGKIFFIREVDDFFKTDEDGARSALAKSINDSSIEVYEATRLTAELVIKKTK